MKLHKNCKHGDNLPRDFRLFHIISRLGVIAAVLCSLALATTSSAQEAGQTGSIAGRVENSAIGMFLDNARVRVAGTNRETFTNQAGEYRFDNLPVGSVTIEVYYTGLEDARMEVLVQENAVTQANVNMKSIGIADDMVVLEEYVVAARKDKDAAALAIQQQRFSNNIKNVVSTDAYGEIHQGNIGEFVKHMPGVNIDFKDGNNASGISIRGFGPNFTNVTMNGSAMASTSQANTSSYNRQYSLEQSDISNIARIEVSKSATADAPANALGGSVNLISKTAFEYAAPKATIKASLSGNSTAMTTGKTGAPTEKAERKIKPSVEGQYILPLNKKLGIILNVTEMNQFYTVDKSVVTRNFKSNGATTTNPYLQTNAFSTAPNTVERTSGSLQVDWKPANEHTFKLTASSSAFLQNSSTRNISYGVGGNAPVSFGESYTTGAATGGSVSMSGTYQNRNSLTRSVDGQYTLTLGAWDATAAATYSNSNNYTRDTAKGFFRNISTSLNGVASVSFDGIDNYNNSISSITARTSTGTVIDTTKLASYNLKSVTSEPMSSDDTVTEFRLTAKRSFDFDFAPTVVKAGVSSNKLVRDMEYQAFTWNYVGADASTTADDSLAGLEDVNLTGTSLKYNQPASEWPNAWAIYRLFVAHPEYFTQTPSQLTDIAKNNATRSPLIAERITSGYLMSDLKLFANKLLLSGGVRYELTEDSGQGYKQTNSGYVKRGTFVKRDYHDFFPSANGAYNITKDLVVRAAFAKTIGRPGLSDIVPNIYVWTNTSGTGDPGVISTNNSSLKPWTAKNYDVAVEYYLPHNGIASIGVFRKDVYHFFRSISFYADEAFLDTLGLSHEYVGYKYTSRINGGNARVQGVEFNYTQSLNFIPMVGRYFIFSGNYTQTSKSGVDATANTFNSFIPRSGNVGLSFAKGRFTAGAYYNYRGRQVNGTKDLYDGATEYIMPVKMLDANISYAIADHFMIYLSGRNLNNATYKWAVIGPGAPSWAYTTTSYTVGRQYTLGLKCTF